MTACVNEFLTSNDNLEIPDSTLWEAFKVVLRGHIISFESSKKRELNNHLKDIEKLLPLLEETYRSSLLQANYSKILQVKYEYNTIHNKHVSNLLLKLRK